MTKQFCDICGKEMVGADIHTITITHVKDGKQIPSTKDREVCVFCKERILNKLSEVW